LACIFPADSPDITSETRAWPGHVAPIISLGGNNAFSQG